jgi:hypothetical protein
MQHTSDIKKLETDLQKVKDDLMKDTKRDTSNDEGIIDRAESATSTAINTLTRDIEKLDENIALLTSKKEGMITRMKTFQKTYGFEKYPKSIQDYGRLISEASTLKAKLETEIKDSETKLKDLIKEEYGKHQVEVPQRQDDTSYADILEEMLKAKNYASDFSNSKSTIKLEETAVSRANNQRKQTIESLVTEIEKNTAMKAKLVEIMSTRQSLLVDAQNKLDKVRVSLVQLDAKQSGRLNENRVIICRLKKSLGNIHVGTIVCAYNIQHTQTLGTMRDIFVITTPPRMGASPPAKDTTIDLTTYRCEPTESASVFRQCKVKGGLIIKNVLPFYVEPIEDHGIDNSGNKMNMTNPLFIEWQTDLFEKYTPIPESKNVTDLFKWGTTAQKITYKLPANVSIQVNQMNWKFESGSEFFNTSQVFAQCLQHRSTTYTKGGKTRKHRLHKNTLRKKIYHRRTKKNDQKTLKHKKETIGWKSLD